MSNQQITGAQALVKALEHSGVDVMFGIPGGAILPAYDPIYDSPIRHILVRHEQGAGHAATGYAQATGKVGVCIATSGPGATNLVTPLADAQMDSVPVVAITGQVASGAIGTDAFQEADIRGITMPVTKHNFLVTDPAEIPTAIAQAFHIASTGRPGAVLVDVAKDALTMKTEFNYPKEINLPGYKVNDEPKAEEVRDAAALIAAAKQPVLYIGGGVIKANAEKELFKLAELTGAPVVTTLMARGAFPDSHKQNLGMPGMHGTVAAVTALQKADLLIFSFPMYWTSVPAILKGWIDRVFVSGIFYGGKRFYNRGGMLGKKAMLSFTLGGRDHMFGQNAIHGAIDDLLLPIQRGTLAYVGFEVLPPFIAYHVPYITNEARQQLLQQYQQHLQNLEQLQALEFPKLEQFDDKLYPL